MSPYAIVTHHKLVNYGLDQSQHMAHASPSKAGYNGAVSPGTLALQHAVVTFKFLVRVTRKQQPSDQKKACLVNRYTGYIVGPKKSFSDIRRFNPDSFPESGFVSIKEVGYWTEANKYIDVQ